MKIETNSCFLQLAAKQVVRKAMVTAVDEAVGKIIDILEATGFFSKVFAGQHVFDFSSTGQKDNTVVVFTSDNGAGEM